jgi:hypothetical protein
LEFLYLSLFTYLFFHCPFTVDCTLFFHNFLHPVLMLFSLDVFSFLSFNLFSLSLSFSLSLHLLSLLTTLHFILFYQFYLFSHVLISSLTYFISFLLPIHFYFSFYQFFYNHSVFLYLKLLSSFLAIFLSSPFFSSILTISILLPHSFLSFHVHSFSHFSYIISINFSFSFYDPNYESSLLFFFLSLSSYCFLLSLFIFSFSSISTSLSLSLTLSLYLSLYIFLYLSCLYLYFSSLSQILFLLLEYVTRNVKNLVCKTCFFGYMFCLGFVENFVTLGPKFFKGFCQIRVHLVLNF